MTMTIERAYEITQQVFTDEIMIEEKRRIYRLLQRKTQELLGMIGAPEALAPYEEKTKLFKQYVHIPGDGIFSSMQYVFNIARGQKEADPTVTQMHVQRIYSVLFTPAGLTNPQIPEMFWESPLGLACLIAEKGIVEAFWVLGKMEE
ncbi:hypothetical protein [Brevibacillus dissolubilis]|uniref:hypothetical protein n=1 Tax=Brevibacillus dissolubilis TaxID=1844116 RepID=UPI001116683B|nr:hypothetical protein [Brevibacillus dissolubilis]